MQLDPPGDQSSTRGEEGNQHSPPFRRVRCLKPTVQRHEINDRQQEGWSAVVALLRRTNEKLSEKLGLDFASNAAPPPGRVLRAR
jgi:hypothetical protein